jgi:hypothetical protein
MSKNENHPLLAFQVGGHGSKQDPYQIGMCAYRVIGEEGVNVNADDLHFNTGLSAATQQEKDSYGGMLDPATPVLIQRAYPGSPTCTVLGQVRNFPKAGTPMPGNMSLFPAHADGDMSLDGNGWSKPMENVPRKGPLEAKNEGGVKVLLAKDIGDHIPSLGNFKPHFQETFDQIGRRWEQFKNVATAETPFSNIINSNMLSQLPGQILSFASAFKGMSSQQKQKIQSSVPPDIYNMIEANLSTDVDDQIEDNKGFNNRIHAETFANNLVDLLCQCTTYSDIVAVKQRMYYDRTLHGLENLPEVEFRVNTGFGEVGIIIDAEGDYRENVSSEVVSAQQEFFNFLVGPENAFEDTAQFYGTIDNNVLTVNKMIYGNVVSGANNIVSGDNIPDSTFIARFETGTGNTGTYIINTSTRTTPNTIMTISSKQEQPQTESSSQNGGGGFPGMSAGSNFFGEASKLIGEIIPVLDPKGQAKIKQRLENMVKQAGGPNIVSGQHALQKVTHVWEKLSGLFPK